MKIGDEGKTLIRVKNSDINNDGAFIIPEGIITISTSAFENCTALESITLPEGVIQIGSQAFWGCTALKSITLPETVTEIGSWAFKGCTALKYITLPKRITTINMAAFYGCTALQFIILPEGITKIDNGLFEGCIALQSITLPEGLTEINPWAFNMCKSLNAIIIPSSDEEKRQAVIDLLSDFLKNRVVSPDLVNQALEIYVFQLSRLNQLPERNPLYLFFNAMNFEVPKVNENNQNDEVLKKYKRAKFLTKPVSYMDDFFRGINRFLDTGSLYQEAKLRMSQVAFPTTKDQLGKYKTDLSNIIEEYIFEFKRAPWEKKKSERNKPDSKGLSNS